VHKTCTLVKRCISDEEIVGERAATCKVFAADPAASTSSQSRAMRRIVDEDAIVDRYVRAPFELKTPSVLGRIIIGEDAVGDCHRAGVEVNPASTLGGIIGNRAMRDGYTLALDVQSPSVDIRGRMILGIFQYAVGKNAAGRGTVYEANPTPVVGCAGILVGEHDRIEFRPHRLEFPVTVDNEVVVSCK